ncbi:hypothetical protein PAE9249_04553 [Paenibacillus sp. CECT 9249]|uniref:helix-turn-helix domain-containing protein n=1 Tax=Paenibacillus sp. CECT 9249 TaxID=2845385 RepID=UPI001E3484ED|nr:helix-turn-helix transcriptional regulator [Paenibacillus sp. CECT 9249]CAH0122016.1 hypothetical protein PAE9249_04553 [Paenibacillus sp. CECT 9249]
MQPKEFGLYLKNLRQSKHLSLTAAARKANISHGYLSQLESGSKGVMPSPEILRKIASALETPITELMYHAGYLPFYDPQIELDDTQFNQENINNGRELTYIVDQPDCTLYSKYLTDFERTQLKTFLDFLYHQRKE